MVIPSRTMAVRLFEYGGPEKLVFGEYDLPELGARDVLVKNYAGSCRAGTSNTVPVTSHVISFRGVSRFLCRSNWGAKRPGR